MTPVYLIKEAICQTFDEVLDFYGFDYEKELTNDEVTLVLAMMKYLILKTNN